MIEEWLAALQALPPVAALRASRWGYALVNACHIAGVALLFGAIVPLDLRLMGWRRSLPIRTLAGILVPVAAAGLILAIGAGALLFSIRATEYAATTLFQVKMALIACALGNALLLRRARQWEAASAVADEWPPPRLRIAGGLSIALWLAVIVCGRLLAFLE
jgi:hypothetical protein